MRDGVIAALDDHLPIAVGPSEARQPLFQPQLAGGPDSPLSRAPRCSLRSAMLATPTSTGGSSRGAAAVTPHSVESLPHLASFSSRLMRNSSTASAEGASSTPTAAGARSGATALPPSQAAHQQQQVQHTPLFGSARTGFSAPLSPGFGSAGGGSDGGIRPRAAARPTPGSGAPPLDYRLGSGATRRLSAPTGYSESGMSGGWSPIHDR